MDEVDRVFWRREAVVVFVFGFGRRADADVADAGDRDVRGRRDGRRY